MPPTERSGRDRRHRRRGRLLAAALFALFILLTIPLPGSSNSHGIEDTTRSGCSCHSPIPGAGIRAAMQGVPATFKSAATYMFTVAIEGGFPYSSTGHHGGFNLRATAGSLSVPLGSADVQITSTSGYVHDDTTMTNRPWRVSGEATHTHEGANRHQWDVAWTAPWPGAGEVKFYLVVQAVDGDHQRSPGDKWQSAEFRSSEGDLDPWTFAWVPLLAVGIVAALAIIVMTRRRKRARRSTVEREERRRKAVDSRKKRLEREMDRWHRLRTAKAGSPIPEGSARCDRCGATVKTKNLGRHRKKVHGGQA